MILPNMKTAGSWAWSLPALALTLLALGLFEYPRALDKEAGSHLADAGSYVRETLLMLILAVAAFLAGWKLRWLERADDVPPYFWIFLALVLALLPPALQMSHEHRVAWHLDLSGFVLHADAGLVSSLAFFAWIASLKANASKATAPQDLRVKKYSVLVLGSIWLLVVILADGYFLFAGLLVFPIAVVVLKGTPWFKESLMTYLIFVVSVTISILTSPYRWRKFTILFFPYGDPVGKHYAAVQTQHAFQASSLFGGDPGAYLPRASGQFILVSLVEHLGWFGLAITVAAVTLFFWATCIRMSEQPACWSQEFGFCIWLYLLAVFIVNLPATSFLSIYPGLGVPFVSHELLLASMAAFITGIAIRGRGDHPGNR